MLYFFSGIELKFTDSCWSVIEGNTMNIKTRLLEGCDLPKSDTACQAGGGPK